MAKTLRIFLVPKTFPERFHTIITLGKSLFVAEKYGNSI